MTREIVITLSLIGIILMVIGLFAPTVGMIGLYVLVAAFAVTLFSLVKGTLPGKGVR